MIVKTVVAFVTLLSVVHLSTSIELSGISQSNDWLINSYASPSKCEPSKVFLSTNPSTLTIQNSLISRTFLIEPAFCTVELVRSLPGNDFSFLRTLTPEGNITLNNTSFDLGGCSGIPIGHAEFFALENYLSVLTPSPNSFQYLSHSTSPIVPPFPFEGGHRGSPSSITWPAKGIHLSIQLSNPINGKGFEGVQIEIHYEIYDCLPVLRKYITVKNTGASPVVISTLNIEILRSPNEAPERLSILLDTATNPSPWDDQVVPVLPQTSPGRSQQWWYMDDDYDACCDRELHVQYTYYTLLIVGYGNDVYFGGNTGPGTLLLTSEEFTSISLRFVYQDSLDLDRKGLAIRRVQSFLAPHSLENPMHMMITDISTDEAFKLAIDQAYKVGFEMVIIGFGANGYCGLCDGQILNATWREWFSSHVKYANSLNIEVSAYTLMQLNGWGESVPASEQILNRDGKSTGGIACFATDFHAQYRQNVLNFIKEVGLGGLETDGQYENAACANDDPTGDHHHNGVVGSWHAQLSSTLTFNTQLKELNVYQTGADSYLFSGANRWNHADTDAGYGLSDFDEYMTMGRMYSYDSTYTRLPSTGMYCYNDLINRATNACGQTGRLACIDFALGSYYASGTWGYLRGPYVYAPSDPDASAIVQIFQRWSIFWSIYRHILIGDFIHVARPNSRNLEITIHSIPVSLNETGTFAIVCAVNPTKSFKIDTIPVSLYYAGVKPGSIIFVNQFVAYGMSEDNLTQTQQHIVGNEGFGMYEIALDVNIPARSYNVFLITIN